MVKARPINIPSSRVRADFFCIFLTRRKKLIAIIGNLENPTISFSPLISYSSTTALKPSRIINAFVNKIEFQQFVRFPSDFPQ